MFDHTKYKVGDKIRIWGTVTAVESADYVGDLPIHVDVDGQAVGWLRHSKIADPLPVDPQAPYIIRAEEYDPELHEQPTVDGNKTAWDWEGWLLDGLPNDFPVVIRNKVKPKDLYSFGLPDGSVAIPQPADEINWAAPWYPYYKVIDGSFIKMTEAEVLEMRARDDGL